jgi:2-oxoglutarate dehydrogenase E2 component (dihydrolipoamide succinyltransferase)
MTRLRQTVAKRLKSAQETAALLTTFNDVDMSAVIEARNKYKDLFEKKHGVRLGFMGFFTKAVCMALKDVPAVNAMIEGDEIVYHNYADISVAVSAPNGLVVPVIRNAEAMSLPTSRRPSATSASAPKRWHAHDGRYEGRHLHHLQWRCVRLADVDPDHQPAAERGAWPAPHRGSAGCGERRDRGAPDDVSGTFSYDHRLIDGREAVTFLVAIKNAIEDPTRLLIDL